MNYKKFLAVFFILLVGVCSFSEQYIVFLKKAEISQTLKGDLSNRATILNELKSNNESKFYSFITKAKTRNIKINNFLVHSGAVVVEGDISELQNRSYFPEIDLIVPDIIEYPEKIVEKDNTPIESFSDEYTYGLKNMNIPQIWEDFNIKGQNIIIGIIDTGLAANHPEWADTNKVIKCWTTNGNVSLSDMTDNNGHGSHVAGTIAGGKLSGKNIGIAPESKLIIAKGIASKGTRASYLLDAMEYMIDPDGNPNTNDYPRAVNCSWHSGYGDQNPYYRMLEVWLQTGIVPCFSAGNSGPSASTITKPKEFPGVFASAAIDENKKIASFSSRGPAKYNGKDVKKPDWASPGVDVYSVRASGGYTTMSGTSMASPHTTGVVALVLSANPKLTVEDVREILKQSSDDAGDIGYDYSYGHGNLDAYKAVSLALSGGFIQGQVKDFSTPIKAQIEFDGRKIFTDENGEFKAMFAEGEYELTVSAFSYTSKKVKVRVKKGETSKLDISLEKAPSITISGKIEDSKNYSGLKGKVSVKGYDISVDTDSNGRYSLDITGGRYSLVFYSYGYNTVEIEEKDYNYSTTQNVKLDRLPAVLLVDNDSGKDYEKYFISSLENSGVKYNYIDISKDTLEEDTILPYTTVFWFTGSLTSNTVKSEHQPILIKYLESGGNLFITGQDIGYNIKNTELYKKYIKAEYVKDASKTKSVSGSGLDFILEDNQKYPDVIKPINGSISIFDYSDNEGCAGISYDSDYKVIYLGFGFEGIGNEDIRNSLMQNIVDFFNLEIEEKLKRIQKLENVVNSVYKDKVISAYIGMLSDEINKADREVFSEEAVEIIMQYKELEEAYFNR
ncbi:MAG: S8 family serine peptidase [Candidatus Muirbacterium halophilum]|nr:S8 family serine peptidase [Candidatus Muirbacterium halophilum]MCK9477439.1 S8 family serine peptidase [Candidatus Muirbacterium halophilum]